MIKITDLHFSYNTHDETEPPILNGINLSIQAGESVAVMGANGSGKTTFARCLNGLLLPERGSVKIAGLDTTQPNNLRQIRRKVGMVFQNPENQIVSTTVEREIAFGLENLGMDYDKMHEIVEKMLTRFDLTKYREHPPHLLSGGEMQRLAVASIVAMSPEIIIFDEPTSLLDPAHCNMILKLILELQQEKTEPPLTTIFITQFPHEALYFNRLLIFHQGRIYLDGSPAEIFLKRDELCKIGLEVPIEFEINDYLLKLSQGQVSLNPSDFLPIR